MEGHEETEEEKIVREEKKELGDLIQDVLKILGDIRTEQYTNATNTTNITKKIEEIMERQSNITANQQLLFNQHKKLLGEEVEKKEEKPE